MSTKVCACLFKLVRGSMLDASSSDMLQFLDDYVHELDDNFTFKKIREACNLDPDRAPPATTSEWKRCEAESKATDDKAKAGSPATTPTAAGATDSPGQQPHAAASESTPDSEEVHPPQPTSQERDQFAKVVRGECGAPSVSKCSDQVLKLRRQAEIVLVALLNGRGDYLNINAIDDLVKPVQTASWGCKKKRTARTMYGKWRKREVHSS